MPPKVLVGPNIPAVDDLDFGESVPNETNSTCPSVNHASEGMDTASPEVKDWMDKKGVPDKYRDGTLGKDGGGGFLKGQTTTKVIPKGTKVFRTCGQTVIKGAVKGARADGGWWSLAEAADPVRDMALPPENPASNQVVGETTQDIEVLAGPGAPRCSNKPGGPEQIFTGLGPKGEGPMEMGLIKPL